MEDDGKGGGVQERLGQELGNMQLFIWGRVWHNVHHIVGGAGIVRHFGSISVPKSSAI